MVEAPIGRGYEVATPGRRHPRSRSGPAAGTATVAAVAASVAISAATRSWTTVAIAALAVVAISGRARAAFLVVLLAGGAVVRSEAAWDDLRPDRVGPFRGWSSVVTEPQRYAGGTRVLLDIEGERHELWVRGRARQRRVDGWRAGDVVRVDGVRAPLDDARGRRVAWQHVVGSFEATWVGDLRPGGRLSVASNRVRALIERGASTLPSERSALARGLVIGDDRDQPPEMVQRFRDSGLAHLTAVSGQNVALLLAAAGPLLARARPFTRWVLSLGLIAWFVVLTRAEPSVLRAGMMAALGATAFALGRSGEAMRSLAVAVIALLLLDPLLAWSVGFWLSVGATAGVTGLGPALAARLGSLGPLALPIGVTLGAQLGVAVPSVLVFGRLSLIGTFANLLAVPVAGLVMLYGLPACLLAGALPAVAPVVVAPVGWGVGWVDAVATVAAAVEPGPPWSWLGWLALAVTVLVMLWAGSRGAPPGRR